jgi:hypothetical protein
MRKRAVAPRHLLDRIARAVVSAARGLGPRADRLADEAAGMMRERLAAAGAPGAARARRRRGRAGPLADAPPAVRRILARTERHLVPIGRHGPDAS